MGLFWMTVALAQPCAELQATVDRVEGLVAVVVEQHGETVFRQQVQRGSTRGPRRDAIEGLHDIRSAGKSITALAVGAAISDGHLASVDSRVWPLLGRDGDPDMTVRDLLTMSSSMDCNDWEGRRSAGYEEKMYRHRVWLDFVSNLPADEGFVRDDNGFGRFAYCTAGVFLLGQVVQSATGEAFDAYVQRRIFDPLEIGPVVWRHSRSGEVQSGGQLEIGPEDLAKLGRMLLDGGNWKGNQVLPEEWVKQMWQPHRQIGPYVYYGYLWWARLAQSPVGPQVTWHMSGNGGNVVAAFREYDAVIVVQARNYNESDAAEKAFEVLSAGLACLEPATPDGGP